MVTSQLTPRQAAIRAHRLAQPEAELRRKAGKATCRSRIMTQEEVDEADVEAERLFRYFHSQDPK